MSQHYSGRSNWKLYSLQRFDLKTSFLLTKISGSSLRSLWRKRRQTCSPLMEIYIKNVRNFTASIWSRTFTPKLQNSRIISQYRLMHDPRVRGFAIDLWTIRALLHKRQPTGTKLFVFVAGCCKVPFTYVTAALV